MKPQRALAPRNARRQRVVNNRCQDPHAHKASTICNQIRSNGKPSWTASEPSPQTVVEDFSAAPATRNTMQVQPCPARLSLAVIRRAWIGIRRCPAVSAGIAVTVIIIWIPIPPPRPPRIEAKVKPPPESVDEDEAMTMEKMVTIAVPISVPIGRMLREHMILPVRAQIVSISQTLISPGDSPASILSKA
jgi:hypothetical protein